MARSVSSLAAVSWHGAVLASFGLLAASLVWEESPVQYGLAALAVLGFLVGLVWLGSRVARHAPLRDPERLKWAVAAALALVAVGLFLPRAFYQWGRVENDSPMPEWAFDVGIGLAMMIALVLLMLFIWLGWAILVRRRSGPSPFETGSALAVAVGSWMLLLGAIIVRTDHTSEDLLHITLPYGLATALAGIALLILSDAWRRARPTAG